MNASLSDAKTSLRRIGGEASFAQWSLTRDGRRNWVRLLALRDRYQGRRAVIMGNGPSLLRSDLNSLADDVTIVSNAHFLIWKDLSYVPTFLTVEDHLVAEDRAAELSALEGTVTMFPFEFRPILGEATPSRIYFNLVRLYRPFPQFSTHFARRGFWAGTVSFVNLQFAHYLGCAPLILIGFDHSYKVPEARESGYVIRSDSEDVNHIHPQYFGPGYRWHDPNVTRMEAAYECARAALDERQVRVVNATAGGQLEVFQRADPDRLGEIR